MSNPGAQDGFSARARTARLRCVGAERGATAVVNVRAAANIVARSRRGVRRYPRESDSLARSGFDLFMYEGRRAIAVVNGSECPNCV